MRPLYPYYKRVNSEIKEKTRFLFRVLLFPFAEGGFDRRHVALGEDFLTVGAEGDVMRVYFGTLGEELGESRTDEGQVFLAERFCACEVFRIYVELGGFVPMLDVVRDGALFESEDFRDFRLGFPLVDKL